MHRPEQSAERDLLWNVPTYKWAVRIEGGGRQIEDDKPASRIGAIAFARKLRENRAGKASQTRVVREIPQMMLEPAAKLGSQLVRGKRELFLQKANSIFQRCIHLCHARRLGNHKNEFANLLIAPVFGALEVEVFLPQDIQRTREEPANGSKLIVELRSLFSLRVKIKVYFLPIGSILITNQHGATVQRHRSDFGQLRRSVNYLATSKYKFVGHTDFLLQAHKIRLPYAAKSLS